MALFTPNPNPLTPSPWGGVIIQAVIIAIVFWVIYTYLLPLLVAPIGTIVLVVMVLLVIIWLLRIAGLI